MVKPILITLILNLVPIQEKKMLLEIETGCQFKITSADRTVSHNKKVGGTANSYHLKKDMAYDLQKIDCDLTYKQIFPYAKKHFSGIILYPNHMHVDLRKNQYHNTNGKY